MAQATELRNRRSICTCINFDIHNGRLHGVTYTRRVSDKPSRLLPVAIYYAPYPSIFLGHETLSADTLRQESLRPASFTGGALQCHLEWYLRIGTRFYLVKCISYNVCIAANLKFLIRKKTASSLSDCPLCVVAGATATLGLDKQSGNEQVPKRPVLLLISLIWEQRISRFTAEQNWV